MNQKKQNIFSIDVASRHNEQESFEKSLTGKSTRKVPMNITLPIEYKNRLVAMARAKGLSASVMIQIWIDEHYN